MFPSRSLWNRLKLTNYSLSVVLLVPFVLLITGTVGLVSYLSFRNGQKAVNDLSSQLRQEILARIDRELQAYFSVPHNINQLSTIAFLQGELKMRALLASPDFFPPLDATSEPIEGAPEFFPCFAM